MFSVKAEEGSQKGPSPEPTSLFLLDWHILTITDRPISFVSERNRILKKKSSKNSQIWLFCSKEAAWTSEAAVVQHKSWKTLLSCRWRTVCSAAESVYVFIVGKWPPNQDTFKIQAGLSQLLTQPVWMWVQNLLSSSFFEPLTLV